MLPLRPNACLLIVNEENKILLAERAGSPGVWQFPQGGLGGDDVISGALREAHEELGVPVEYFEVLHVLKVQHSYEFKVIPPHCQGKWRGQHQHYVILRYLGKDSEISLDCYEQELSSWRWCTIEEIRDLAEPIRLEGYEKAFAEIKECGYPYGR